MTYSRKTMFASLCSLVAACGSPTQGPTQAAPTAPTTPTTSTAPISPASATGAVRLAAIDVTTVWPLPSDAAKQGTMLAATSVGGHGELLPASLYQLPVLDQRDSAATNAAADHARLRVVAARFEPCRGSFGPPTEAACVNQVRLVMQVLRPGGGGAPASTIGANDGAVLAFYKITREELLALAREVVALRAAHGGASTDEGLGVHPLLASQGLGSEYANKLQAAFLKVVGAKRLTKITFFARTRAREPEWPFGSFNVVDGKLVKNVIPTLAGDLQSLEGTFRKTIRPVTSSPDNPDALLTVFGQAREATAAERTAFGALLRIQNPTKHNPDTMACAECHAAQHMQAAAEKVLGLRATDFAADAFTSKVQPAPDKISGENFHAASYLGTNLAVAVRTANETSAVLEAMGALLAR